MSGPIPRGGTAVELNPAGLITRVSAVWDGSLLSDADVNALQAYAIAD